MIDEIFKMMLDLPGWSVRKIGNNELFCRSDGRKASLKFNGTGSPVFIELISYDHAGRKNKLNCSVDSAEDVISIIDGSNKPNYNAALKDYQRSKQIKPSFPEPTGELQMFREIWAKRVGKDGRHRSEISSKPLIENVHHKLWVNQFMHILPKSNYEGYRLREENIILGTWEEHFKQTNRPGDCKTDPQWDGFWAKYAALYDEYLIEFPVRGPKRG